jgi:hypothetical protein
MDLRPLLLLLLPLVGPAQAGRPEEEKLAASLREILLGSLPTPLFEDAKHWGMQKKGLGGKLRNDGKWWKLRVSRRSHPAAVLAVRDLRSAGPGKQTFTLALALPTQIDLERQTWLMGVRLFSGSTRARVNLFLTLECMAEARLETTKGAFLPDVVIQVRVIRSELKHDSIVVEHTAGVGGEAARAIGDVLIALVKQVYPSLEKSLISRANAAILKAGDSKEVRLSLSKVLEGKK